MGHSHWLTVAVVLLHLAPRNYATEPVVTLSGQRYDLRPVQRAINGIASTEVAVADALGIAEQFLPLTGNISSSGAADLAKELKGWAQDAPLERTGLDLQRSGLKSAAAYSIAVAPSQNLAPASPTRSSLGERQVLTPQGVVENLQSSSSREGNAFDDPTVGVQDVYEIVSQEVPEIVENDDDTVIPQVPMRFKQNVPPRAREALLESLKEIQTQTPGARSPPTAAQSRFSAVGSTAVADNKFLAPKGGGAVAPAPAPAARAPKATKGGEALQPGQKTEPKDPEKATEAESAEGAEAEEDEAGEDEQSKDAPSNGEDAPKNDGVKDSSDSEDAEKEREDGEESIVTPEEEAAEHEDADDDVDKDDAAQGPQEARGDNAKRMPKKPLPPALAPSLPSVPKGGPKPSGPQSAQTEAANATQCAAGTFVLGKSGKKGSDTVTCEACDVGTYSSEAGATECTACAAGDYAHRPRMAYCNPCPPGYECPIRGTSDPALCEKDTYAPGGSQRCRTCSLFFEVNHYRDACQPATVFYLANAGLVLLAVSGLMCGVVTMLNAKELLAEEEFKSAKTPQFGTV